MPRLLTLGQMLHRKTVSGKTLEHYLDNPKEFLDEFQVWIKVYILDSKLQSKQGITPEESTSKKGEVNFASYHVDGRYFLALKGIFFMITWKRAKVQAVSSTQVYATVECQSKGKTNSLER